MGRRSLGDEKDQVILVDSSGWIDYFNGRESKETNFLHDAFSTDILCVGDIIIAEVLQGFKSDKSHRQARELLLELPCYRMLSPELALKSSDNYRNLRKKGITVRQSVDVWIATFCIENKLPLLFSDKDFLPFVEFLHLRTPIVYT